MSSLLLSGALCLAFLTFFWMSPFGVPVLTRIGGGVPPPDLRFGYGPRLTYDLIETYGPAGVGRWRRLLLADMIFPACYGLFLAQLIWSCLLWAAADTPWRLAAIAFPLVAAAADYAENLLLLRVLRALPARHPGLIRTASGFTRIKFVALFVTLALLVVAGLLGLTGRMGWV